MTVSAMMIPMGAVGPVSPDEGPVSRAGGGPFARDLMFGKE